MSTQAEREAEIEELIARALDPDDPYDGACDTAPSGGEEHVG